MFFYLKVQVLCAVLVTLSECIIWRSTVLVKDDIFLSKYFSHSITYPLQFLHDDGIISLKKS